MYAIKKENGELVTTKEAYDIGVIPEYGWQQMSQEERNRTMQIGCREMAVKIACLFEMLPTPQVVEL